MSRTLKDLISSYQTHRLSDFHRLRFHVRKWHVSMLARIDRHYGHFLLKDIRAGEVIGWHADWVGEGKISMGHALVSQLRTLFGFGLTLLEDEDCVRLCMVLHKRKFPMGQPRDKAITAGQIIAIRNIARDQCRYSIALAQVLQFELILRQKDVIGEYVPLSEPGISGVTTETEKWLRGLRWEEIGENMILKHLTSKKQKFLEIDLKLAPMVIEEFGTSDRTLLPASGPIIISESTGYPYRPEDYRRKWHLIADMAGISKDVKNMDSRAGGISEATDAGADIEHVRHAATHSDIAQTQKYSRRSNEKVAIVQAKRLEYRNRNAS
ncbi:MAG TPA: hypothetical protein VG097_11695 [Gemmata sp.]|nr:hypothetical protein [Gemmata sp.]